MGLGMCVDRASGSQEVASGAANGHTVNFHHKGRGALSLLPKLCWHEEVPLLLGLEDKNHPQWRLENVSFC